MTPEYIVYSDTTGREYVETATSPIAVSIREEELTQAGYTVVKG